MSVKRTTDTFIGEAHLKHNHKYDYSRTVYRGRHELVIIICPIHGEFEQEAGSHLAGRGCYDCGRDACKKPHRPDLVPNTKIEGSRLTFREYLDPPTITNRDRRARFSCECGNDNFVTKAFNVIYGNTKSCYCLVREAARRMGQSCRGKRKPIEKRKLPRKRKYNDLTIQHFTGNFSEDGRPMVMCDCRCGKSKEIELKQVLSGNTKSCGCRNEEWKAKFGPVMAEQNPKNPNWVMEQKRIGGSTDGRYERKHLVSNVWARRREAGLIGRQTAGDKY